MKWKWFLYGREAPGGGPDYYVDPVSRPVFMTFVGLLYVAGFFMLTWFFWTYWEWSALNMAGFLVYLGGTWGIIDTWIAFLRDSYHIWLESDHIRGRGIYAQSKIMPYAEIIGIREHNRTRVRTELVARNEYGTTYKIWFSAGLVRYGELVERIMDQAVNCTEIKIDKQPRQMQRWKKEPNMDLIGRAIARAQENATRLQ